jgi:hypothetical protein
VERAVAAVKVPGGTIRQQNMAARQYAACIQNAGFEASLEVRKRYPVIEDAAAERDGLIRVVDESAEDYVYPARLFVLRGLSESPLE